MNQHYRLVQRWANSSSRIQGTSYTHIMRIRSRCLLFCFVTALVLCVVSQLQLFYSLLFHPKELQLFRGIAHSKNRTPFKGRVVVLMWTLYYGQNESILNSILSESKILPEWCEVTFDRSRLNNSHAVIFHIPGNELSFRDLPKSRKSDQLWTFLSIEPAAYYPRFEYYRNINAMGFNRTMTYRLDSDYPMPYGYASIKSDNVGRLPEGLDSLLNGRSELIAWVVSNCISTSYRESVARDLANHVRVDIYGDCGRLNCTPKDDNTVDCYAVLARKYKFYLSFENSLCKDYITEKFTDSLYYHMVPIVYGAGNYSKILPYPHSFINSRDFTDAKALADYLQYLARNQTAYMEYFEWTRYLEIKMRRGYEGWGRLCQSIANGDQHRHHTYTNMKSWWHQCHYPRVRQ